MLKDLDIDLEVVKSPVSLGIENEIVHVDNLDSVSRYQDMLKRIYPDNDKDIDRLIRTIRKIMKHMDVLYGIENPVFKDLKKDTSFIFKVLLPWLPRFIFTVGKINRMKIPVEEFLKTIIKNRSLRDIIHQHFFKNTPTFFALSYFSLYLDYFYPRGGVGKLSEALERKIIEFGGEIRSETKITRVIPGSCVVKDDQNTSYHYKNLVWAADLKTLYKITETDNLPVKIKSEFSEVKLKMMKSRGGESVFTLFLEVDEPIESFGKISNGHFFYTPSKQGLGETHGKALNELLGDFSNVSKEQVLAWLDQFTALNTYEISVPGLKDAELVPPGKTGLIVSFLAEYDLFVMIREAGWLDEFILELENRVLGVLSDSIYPMLKDKVIDRFSFSPLSIENRVGSSEGAITGWAFQNNMPVINKIQIADRSVITPLPSIYQAGQWAYSPAGVPMSILTGKLAANKVIKG